MKSRRYCHLFSGKMVERSPKIATFPDIMPSPLSTMRGSSRRGIGCESSQYLIQAGFPLFQLGHEAPGRLFSVPGIDQGTRNNSLVKLVKLA